MVNYIDNKTTTTKQNNKHIRVHNNKQNKTRKMPALEEFKNFFNKNEEERSLLYSRQNATILKKDKKIASYLGKRIST